MGLDLNGKVALVTGADQGIGAATSAELVREDMHLCRAARDSARLQSVTDTLVKRKANVTVLVTTAEAPDPATDGQAIARVVGHFSRLDLPVNNAEATKRADFFTLTEENWSGRLVLKFHGDVKLTRVASPHPRASNGSIVNIAGIGARAGSAKVIIGGSVKAA